MIFHWLQEKWNRAEPHHRLGFLTINGLQVAMWIMAFVLVGSIRGADFVVAQFFEMWPLIVDWLLVVLVPTFFLFIVWQ